MSSAPKPNNGKFAKKKVADLQSWHAIPKFADDPPLKTLEDGPISGIESGESGESEDQSEDLLQKRDASDDVFAIASRS